MFAAGVFEEICPGYVVIHHLEDYHAFHCYYRATTRELGASRHCVAAFLVCADGRRSQSRCDFAGDPAAHRCVESPGPSYPFCAQDSGAD